AFYRRFWVTPPGVMRFIVDYDDVLRASHFSKDFAHIGFVAQRAALVHGFPFCDALSGLPVEFVPVHDFDFSLAQAVMQAGRNQPKLRIEVSLVGWFQHLQTILDGQSRSNNENVLREAFVLRITGLIDDLPRDQHGHDNRFPGASRHFRADACEVPAVRRNVDSDTLRGRGLREPDESFHCFDLAEEEPVVFALLRVAPVFQEALRNSRDARITGFAPPLDAGPNLVREWESDEYAGVIEGFRAFRGAHVASGAAARHTGEKPGFAVVLPVFGRLAIRRVDDELIDGLGGRGHRRGVPRFARSNGPQQTAGTGVRAGHHKDRNAPV